VSQGFQLDQDLLGFEAFLVAFVGSYEDEDVEKIFYPFTHPHWQGSGPQTGSSYGHNGPGADDS